VKKKITFFTILMLIVLTVVAGAAGINGDFKGFPIVKVQVNGSSINSEVPAVNFFGKTVLPVRDIAETLGTIVEWNGETWTANLIKPEVHMIFTDNIEENEEGQYIFTNPFTLMSLGENNAFFTFADIAGLKPGKYEFRTVIVNSNNEAIYSTAEDNYEVTTEDSTGFYSFNYYENIPFHQSGEYKFQFQIKHNDTYKTVSEKTLTVY